MSTPAEIDEVEVETPAAQQPAPEETPSLEPVPRDRLQQQLDLLKQREAELRRELAIADHPALADAIRTIEGRAYGIARVEAKMAEGLGKSERRRKDTLEKKLAAARDKRQEIDARIEALEQQLAPLGEARLAAFDADRTRALLAVVAALEEHEAALRAASLDIALLVPDLSRWRTEIDALRARARA